MSIEEFNKANFHAGMMVEHIDHGDQGEIVSINFHEKLIAYRDMPDEEPNWCRCENLKIL